MTPDPYLAVPKWLDAAPGPRSTKIILVRVDDHRNNTTGQCNPRLQTLARETGFSVRSVTRALAELRRLGLVTSRRTQRGNHYVCAPRTRWKDILSNGQPVQLELDILANPSTNEPSPIELTSFCDVPCVTSGVRDSDEPAAAARQEYKQPEDAEQNTTRPRCTPRASNEVEKSAVQPETEMPSCQPEPDKATALAAELAAQHPEPGLLGRVPEQIRGVLRRAPNLEVALTQIRESHNRWRIFWLEHPGRFRPQLWRWFYDGDWEHPPVDAAFVGSPPPSSSGRKPVARETSCDRCGGSGFAMVTRRGMDFSEPCACRGAA